MVNENGLLEQTPIKNNEEPITDPQLPRAPENLTSNR
jgi:hypothetical protein